MDAGCMDAGKCAMRQRRTARGDNARNGGNPRKCAEIKKNAENVKNCLRAENRVPMLAPLPANKGNAKKMKNMKTTFEYNHAAAVELACGYSENPETLRGLIARLEIEVGPHTVVPSPWNKDTQLKALHMLVAVNGYAFAYYGSHAEAEAMEVDLFCPGLTPAEKQRRKMEKIMARKHFREGLLYSLLANIGGDYSAASGDPEDIGLDRDSIKDMAKWNEICEHARKLQAALRLTREELESLPS